MPTARANDIDIYYQTQGSGDPLVLISGLGYDWWMWHKMIPGLARHFQVITFDNRGAGETDKPPGPYSAQLLAADTAGLLAALGIERAAVMGHSMGGFVAQALALDYPDLVDKLILSATNYGGPKHIPITQEALAILTDMTADPIERLTRGIEVSCGPGYAEANPDFVQEWLAYRAEHPIDPTGYQAQTAIGFALLPAETCFEPRLGAVRAPTLILFGEHDKVVPPGNAQLLAKQIPNSRIEVLPDVGHFFPLEAPKAANQVLLDFLAA